MHPRAFTASLISWISPLKHFEMHPKSAPPDATEQVTNMHAVPGMEAGFEAHADVAPHRVWTRGTHVGVGRMPGRISRSPPVLGEPAAPATPLPPKPVPPKPPAKAP